MACDLPAALPAPAAANGVCLTATPGPGTDPASAPAYRLRIAAPAALPRHTDARTPAVTDAATSRAAAVPATAPPVDARTPASITPNTLPDDPLSDPEVMSAARSLRERFLGALLGLAVGDAVAAATQFRKPGTFTPVGDMIGGGPVDLPRGAWSDDTAMTLCLADSLLERDGFDARDQMERYRRWQQ